MSTTQFTDDDITTSIDQHDTSGHPDAPAPDEIRGHLAAIQASFETYWSEHLDAIDDDHLSVVHEDPEVLVLADHTGHGWHEELDALDTTDDLTHAVLKSVHHTAASRLSDYAWTASNPFVIWKPDGWQQGEQHVERRVAQLAQAADVSEPAAMDYWQTQIRGWSQSAWARAIGKDQSTISQNIGKVETGRPGPELS
jgi:hypothetical protein